jgi:hypothetical protein
MPKLNSHQDFIIHVLMIRCAPRCFYSVISLVFLVSCPFFTEEALTLEFQGNNCYVSAAGNSGTRRLESSNPVAGVLLWLAGNWCKSSRFQGIAETEAGWCMKY